MLKSIPEKKKMRVFRKRKEVLRFNSLPVTIVASLLKGINYVASATVLALTYTSLIIVTPLIANRYIPPRIPPLKFSLIYITLFGCQYPLSSIESIFEGACILLLVDSTVKTSLTTKLSTEEVPFVPPLSN